MAGAIGEARCMVWGTYGEKKPGGRTVAKSEGGVTAGDGNKVARELQDISGVVRKQSFPGSGWASGSLLLGLTPRCLNTQAAES